MKFKGKAKRIEDVDLPRIGLAAQAKDLTGMRFGFLVIAFPTRRGKNGDIIWAAVCDCGGIIEDRAYNLKQYKGCGCQQATSGQRSFKHGHTTDSVGTTPTYNSWQAMRKRCRDPKGKGWLNYGGRGISVCERWNDFTAFLEDMGERPDGLTIDRIDPDGNYEPDNCRWADAFTQRHNRSLAHEQHI